MRLFSQESRVVFGEVLPPADARSYTAATSAKGSSVLERKGNDVDTDLPASAYAPFRAWSGLDARDASGRRGCHRTLDQWIFRETTLAVACTEGASTFGGVAYGYCPSIGEVRCLLGRQPLDQDGLGQVLGPPQTTIRQSWMPRFWISDRTRSQYFAPSPSLCSPAHSPRMSLVPSEVTASAR